MFIRFWLSFKKTEREIFEARLRLEIWFADEQWEKVDKLVRDDPLQEKFQEQQDPNLIPLILTCNRFSPNLTAAVWKNWNILQTNKNLRELFQEHPITAFKRNKDLKETIGGIQRGKVQNFNIPSRKGKCTPCLSGTRTLYCNQVLTTNTFMIQQTKGKCSIFFNLKCKSEYVILLMECSFCKMRCNMSEKQRQHLTQDY